MNICAGLSEAGACFRFPFFVSFYYEKSSEVIIRC